MEVVIKRFQELSLQELYNLLRCRMEVFVLEQNIIYQDLDHIDQHSTHMFFTEEGEILSYLRIIDPGIKYKEPSIGRVLTMPSFRHKGLSRKLMELAILHVRKDHQMPMRIEAQEYLEDFYKSLGFRSITKPFILEGISHVSMILE